MSNEEIAWPRARAEKAKAESQPRGAREEDPRAEAEAAPTAAAGSRGAALRDEDLVVAELSRFRSRVDRALETIAKAAKEHGPIGVAFSGGKDSTVTLDLVRRVIPAAPCALFDSGTEFSETIAMAQSVGAEIVTPRMSMLDMARYAGWWGHRSPVDKGCEFDAKAVLIQEPSEAFVVRRRLRTMAHGVRSEESTSRSKHASRGELYQGADRTWYLMPVLWWTVGEIWAYIASRGLRYHPHYDAMARAGVPRESQRVSGALGERGSGWGRHVMLRQLAPRIWSQLASEFPLLASDSL